MWITGFTDAEGCFSIIIEIKNSLKWRVRASFEINLHLKDKEILYRIKEFFGVGNVFIKSSKNLAVFRISNPKLLDQVIIPHYKKYSLISKKAGDFLLWSEVINLMLNKEHLNKLGLEKILTYYASINRGVLKKVLIYYPNILPCKKPIINLPVNLDPNWVSGFTAGDGGFSIYVKPAKNYILKEKVYFRFHIAQHNKDLELIKLLINFFACGVVYIRSNILTPRCDFIVQDFYSILDKIIPHFDKYSLNNLKEKDYLCFKDVICLMKDKKHLTKEGLNQIKKISLNMNSNRFLD